MNAPAPNRRGGGRSRALERLKRLDAALAPTLARVAARSPRRALPTEGRAHDVVVVRLWGLGNLALMAPLWASFAGTGKRLRLITLERNRSFMRDHWPHVEVLGLPAPYRPSIVTAFASVLAGLRREPADVVLDAESFLSLPTACVRAACSAPIVGVATPGQHRAALLDIPIAHDELRHAAETFAAIAERGGVALDGQCALRPAAPAVGAIDARLPRNNASIVVLHPGSGDHFPGRRWPVERFARVARALHAAGHTVVVTGDRHERALAATVCLSALDGALDLSAQLDTAELVALLARAALLVTNDTGPLHIADALGTPTVALFGPNTPQRYGPRTPGSVALFADLPCSPCLDERTRKSSSCTTFECMDALSVSAALAACTRALATSSHPSPRAVTADA